MNSSSLEFNSDEVGRVRQLAKLLRRPGCDRALSDEFALQICNVGKAVAQRIHAEHGLALVRWDEWERAAIVDALTACKGSVLAAARRLGIGKTTLYRKVREYGILLQNHSACRCPLCGHVLPKAKSEGAEIPAEVEQ